MNINATAPPIEKTKKKKKKKKKKKENTNTPDGGCSISEGTAKRPRRKREVQVDIWSAQCSECLKWRVIPEKGDYEEMRCNLVEHPFACNRLPEGSCDVPPDIEINNERVWMIDKPGIPTPPRGFERNVFLRKGCARCDCNYTTPCGKNLRANADVAAFLKTNPEEYGHLKGEDFSFSVPKILLETIPDQHILESQE